MGVLTLQHHGVAPGSNGTNNPGWIESMVPPEHVVAPVDYDEEHPKAAAVTYVNEATPMPDFYITNENEAGGAVTDDLHALPEFQNLTTAKVAISPIVLKGTRQTRRTDKQGSA